MADDEQHGGQSEAGSDIEARLKALEEKATKPPADDQTKSTKAAAELSGGLLLTTPRQIEEAAEQATIAALAKVKESEKVLVGGGKKGADGSSSTGDTHRGDDGDGKSPGATDGAGKGDAGGRTGRSAPPPDSSKPAKPAEQSPGRGGWLTRLLWGEG